MVGRDTFPFLIWLAVILCYMNFADYDPDFQEGVEPKRPQDPANLQTNGIPDTFFTSQERSQEQVKLQTLLLTTSSLFLLRNL